MSICEHLVGTDGQWGTGVSASASTLYLLSEEQPSPGKTNLNLLAVNVLNNSSSVVLQLPVPRFV